MLEPQPLTSLLGLDMDQTIFRSHSRSSSLRPCFERSSSDSLESVASKSDADLTRTSTDVETQGTCSTSSASATLVGYESADVSKHIFAGSMCRPQALTPMIAVRRMPNPPAEVQHEAPVPNQRQYVSAQAAYAGPRQWPSMRNIRRSVSSIFHRRTSKRGKETSLAIENRPEDHTSSLDYQVFHPPQKSAPVARDMHSSLIDVRFPRVAPPRPRRQRRDMKRSVSFATFGDVGVDVDDDVEEVGREARRVAEVIRKRWIFSEVGTEVSEDNRRCIQETQWPGLSVFERAVERC